MNRKRLIIRIAGAIVGIGLICILVLQTDISSLAEQIKMVGWYFWAALGVTFFSQFTAVVAWYLSFLEPLKRKSLVSLFNIRLIGESLAQINPTSVLAGDTLKGILLKDKLGVNYLTGAASILLSRIMIILAGSILIILGVAIMFQRLSFGNLKLISIILCVVIVAILFAFIYALKKRRGILRIIANLIEVVFGRFAWSKKVALALIQVDDQLIEFYHKKTVSFYMVLFLSLLHRIIGSLEYFVIFYVLGINVDILSCILFDLSSMLFRAAGFFIPGQLGFEEFGNKLMFSLVNIPGDETWITVSLARRGRQIFWILAGFVAYLFFAPDIKKSLEKGLSPDEQKN